MKLSCLVLLALCPLAAQEQEEGRFLYRGNCAFCHGLTGGGGRGPALARGQLLHGSTREDLVNVIRNGIPGTNMPSFDMEPDEYTHLANFILRLSSAGAAREAVAGDPAKGRNVFSANGCFGCHRIGNQGGVFGPDLTRIGAARSSDYIRDSIVNPSADIPPEYEGVEVVLPDSIRVRGVRVNEDTFTVQLREIPENIRMFRKSDVLEVIHLTRSLMPAYDKLATDDLRNLLAYLDSLRGDLQAGAEVKKAEGIR